MYFRLGIWTGVDDSTHGAKIVTRGIDAPPVSVAFRHSWFVDRKILRIGMGRDKVKGQVIVMAVAEKIVDPYGAPRNGEWIERLARGLRPLQRSTVHIEVACGRAADSKLRINCLDRFRCYFIQLKIFFLRATAKKRLIEIGLVPNFEVPLTDLVQPITLDAVLHESMHEVCPFVVVGRRASVRVPPERCVVDRSQWPRREAQLHKGTYSLRQHSVIQVID